ADWRASKSADPAGSAPAGGTMTYTLLLENTGGAGLTGLVITDDLSGVLDDATYNSGASVSPNVGTVTFDAGGGTLEWTGDLAASQSLTITYSVTVDDPGGLADGNLVNAVLGPPNCPGDACSTT